MHKKSIFSTSKKFTGSRENIQYNEKVIDHRDLVELRNQLKRLNIDLDNTINIKDLNFTNLSSLSYFEALIYILCLEKKSSKIIIKYENLSDALALLQSSILKEFQSIKTKELIISPKKFIELYVDKAKYIKTEEIETYRFHYKDDINLSDILTLMKQYNFISRNITNSFKSILSELISNVRNHDWENKDSFNISIFIRKWQLSEKFDAYEFSFINYCGKKIIENYIQYAPDEIKKLEEVSEFETPKNAYVFPMLFVDGVSTRFESQQEMGGTGLRRIQQKIYENLSEENDQFKEKLLTYVVCENIELDLNENYNSDSIEEFIESVKGETLPAKEIFNSFNGLIYNIFLIDEKEETIEESINID